MVHARQCDSHGYGETAHSGQMGLMFLLPAGRPGRLAGGGDDGSCGGSFTGEEVTIGEEVLSNDVLIGDEVLLLAPVCG